MEKTNPLFISITDRKNVIDLLSKLSPETIPAFGTLTPQHMIEHLIQTIRYSNGKESIPLLLETTRAGQIKTGVINTENELPKGFKSPLLPKDGLAILKYPDLQTAIDVLKSELAHFDQYFKENPEAKPVNPLTGELALEEWLVFHGKHFTHHFKQFGLL